MSKSTTNKISPPIDELLAIERFILDSQYRIHQLMEAKNVSRSELANRLGVSRSRVSQFFGHSPNVTLETLGRIFAALEEEGKISSTGIEARLAEISRKIHSESQFSSMEWQIRAAKPEKALAGGIASTMAGIDWVKSIETNIDLLIDFRPHQASNEDDADPDDGIDERRCVA